ncbi:hypothetical protein AB1N83_005658 [Pleurotus pulmonarius]
MDPSSEGITQQAMCEQMLSEAQYWQKPQKPRNHEITKGSVLELEYPREDKGASLGCVPDFRGRKSPLFRRKRHCRS